VAGAVDVSFGDVVPLCDPVGTAYRGSAWPAFARRYHLETGAEVAVVNSAYGASALLSSCDRGMGNWSAEGELRSAALSATGRAIRALTVRGSPPRVMGVIWAQGEREAVERVTTAAYAEALSTLIAWSRETLRRPHLPWFISLIGAPSSGDPEPFAEIRRAQMRCAEQDPRVVVGYADAYSFPARGWMSDDVHYSAAGYAHMGDSLGVSAASLAGTE